jgi:hypothetical protein
MHPLPHTPSWLRVSSLKHGENFTFLPTNADIVPRLGQYSILLNPFRIIRHHSTLFNIRTVVKYASKMYTPDYNTGVAYGM